MRLVYRRGSCAPALHLRKLKRFAWRLRGSVLPGGSLRRAEISSLALRAPKFDLVADGFAVSAAQFFVAGALLEPPPTLVGSPASTMTSRLGSSHFFATRDTSVAVIASTLPRSCLVNSLVRPR